MSNNARSRKVDLTMSKFVKKKTSFAERNRKAQEVNKKAIIWVGAVLVAIVIIMTVLMILDKS